MYHDNMILYSNNIKFELIKFGKKLGLNKKDIDNMLIEADPRNEQTSFSLGPPWYCGGYYGTVSINEFQYNSKIIKRSHN